MKINDNKGKNIVSNTLNIIMYWLKTLSQYNKNEFAYHSVYLDCSKNQSNNEDYDFEGWIVQISISETM